MLDFEISKKLNIKAEKIDLDKSYYSFNPNTCYLTIELYLKKDVDIICPICGSREILIRGSKLSVIKTSFIDSNNVIVNVHRRIYKCYNNHSFIQDNPLSPEGRKISIQKDILILNALSYFSLDSLIVNKPEETENTDFKYIDNIKKAISKYYSISISDLSLN